MAICFGSLYRISLDEWFASDYLSACSSRSIADTLHLATVAPAMEAKAKLLCRIDPGVLFVEDVCVWL